MSEKTISKTSPCELVVWALFDSGNGCYFQGVQELRKDGVDITIYSIGLDVESKNNHFIHLNLADYSYFFSGNNTIYETLDKLPKADLIIASPPCESWSVASAMSNGNACWKQEKADDCLFEPQVPLSPFTIRDYEDYNKRAFIPENQLIKRINGELCTYNLIQIIKRYNPKYYIIENPATSKIWRYIDRILGFQIPYDNLTHYNQYDNYPLRKPTKFKSNIELELKTGDKNSEMQFREMHGYNNRSNIPLSLVKDIFKQVVYKETQYDNIQKNYRRNERTIRT